MRFSHTVPNTSQQYWKLKLDKTLIKLFGQAKLTKNYFFPNNCQSQIAKTIFFNKVITIAINCCLTRDSAILLNLHVLLNMFIGEIRIDLLLSFQNFVFPLNFSFHKGYFDFLLKIEIDNEI